MKGIFIFLTFLSLYVYGDVYYAKMEPMESYTIKSSVSGEVIKSDISKEGKFIKNALIIKIDDAVNMQDLKTSKEKLKSLKEIEAIDRQNLKNAKLSYEIKKRNYDRIKNLKTKSIYEKDNQLISVISAQNQYLIAKQTLQNVKTQIDDLKYKIFVLKDTINKKNIYIKDRLLYKLYVKKGDYVNPGSRLMDVHDISKAKLTIYLSYEDMVNLDKKSIYINGKKSDVKFHKVWKVADTINISSYKAELYMPAPKIFSKVVKIELR